MPDETLVVVFVRAALDRLADPAAAVADARSWSHRVGVVDDDPRAARARLDDAGVDPDFVAGAAGVTASLPAIRQRLPADRHLLIGTDADTQEMAEARGWDHLPVAVAADKAGWELE